MDVTSGVSRRWSWWFWDLLRSSFDKLSQTDSQASLLSATGSDLQLQSLAVSIDDDLDFFVDLQSLDGVGIVVHILNLAPGEFYDNVTPLTPALSAGPPLATPSSGAPLTSLV